MARLLPGAYISLNDMSQSTEGPSSLTVGYVVQTDRGPMKEATLTTSFSNFLKTFTFGGKPSIKADPTIWELEKVFNYTNRIYISRAANNPLYGGAVFTKGGTVVGEVVSVNNSVITLADNVPTAVTTGTRVILYGIKGVDNGCYKVASKSGKTVTLAETITASTVLGYEVVKAVTEEVESVTKYAFQVTGEVVVVNGDIITVKGNATAANNGDFTVTAVTYDSNTGKSMVYVQEAVVNDGEGGTLFTKVVEIKTSSVIPMETSVERPIYPVAPNTWGSDELFVLFGKDPGKYNGELVFNIAQGSVYYKGADIGGEPCTFDTITLTIANANTGEVLETFTFSKDVTAKTIDGIPLYIEEVLANSSYVQVVNNEAVTDLPTPTIVGVKSGAGSNGGEVTKETLISALTPFKDKALSVSLLGNGCSYQAENEDFHTALLEVTNIRKDCFAFLNNRRTDEDATDNDERARNIIDYKKNDLASTSFYGTMYCPHLKTVDTINQVPVKIGASGVAMAGWLNIINTLNYPYAYAGVRNGLITGATAQWKIGDTSGIAEALNDASVNYVAYDAKVGRYYMQCQNTLQIANSSMRNIGAVLNILDIKEHFEMLLKEFTQLPITSSLRSDIYNICNDYLNPMVGNRIYAFTFQDVTTEVDIADNTLRYLLTISLTQYAQKIFLVMNIVNATFDFAITQSA